ncbi:hypothetical protein D3C78_1592030 [compost metagenome]
MADAACTYKTKHGSRTNIDLEAVQRKGHEMGLDLRNDRKDDPLNGVGAYSIHRFKRAAVDALQCLVGELCNNAQREDDQRHDAWQGAETDNGYEDRCQQQIGNSTNQVEHESDRMTQPAHRCNVAGAKQGNRNGQ